MKILRVYSGYDSKYWRAVAGVFTGSVIAQSIPVLGALLIARLYTPDAFGLFSAWLGLVVLLSVLLTGRYEMALVIEEDGPARQRATWATLFITLAMAVLAAVATGLVKLVFPGILEMYDTMLLLLWAPAALTMAGCNIWQSLAAAEGEYRKLTQMRIALAGLVTIFQVVGGIWSSSPVMLAFAQFVGGVFALGLSIYWLPPARIENPFCKPGEMLAFLKRRQRFPLYSLPADFINTSAAYLPVLILAHRFGADVAGYLALTMRVLGAPVGLLGHAVLDVFKRHAAKAFRQRGECRVEYVKNLKVLSVSALLFTVATLLLSEWLFRVAFGETWSQAGTMAIWLLPIFALGFVASPLSYIVYIAEKQHLDLFWQIALLGMTLASLSAVSDYRSALLVYSYGYGLLYVIYLGLSYRLSLGERL